MNQRALVLGGGGVTGVAWEIGIIAGLAEAGVDLTAADVVIGTSAGSVVGAQITGGATAEELYERQLEPATGELAATFGPGIMLRYVVTLMRSRDDRKARANLGRKALAATTVPEKERRAVIASRLTSHDWPERRLMITAVDAHTGDDVVFDAASGVPLVDAVAASCAVPLVWPPVTIDGRRYVDGGVRSPTNADLATGCDPVVVLAPTLASPRRSGRVPDQLATLGAGVRSVVVSPDATARSTMGRNVLDPAFRAAAARAGRVQAASVAGAVIAVW